MRKLLGASVAAIALIMSAGASAHATEGWYGRFDVGYSVDGELEIEGSEFDLDNNWMVSGAVGTRLSNGLRVEGELAYRQNELEDVGDVEVEVVSLLANAIWDFNRGGRFQPYVGVGAGVGRLQIDEIDAEDTGFAWQVMAGVGVPLSERMTLDIGYRYFAMPNIDLEYGRCYEDARVTAQYENGYGCEIEADYTHQAVLVGLRWQFAAPAAPPPPPPEPAPLPEPPPAPPPCPAASFVVYFEWDRSNLNEAAVATIDQAVSAAQACNLTAVAVIGHTDTSGPAAYNVGLSERRSSVVVEALVARGIPGAAISSEWRGETDLAQTTGDNTRKPLNRRTAVTISFN